MNKLLILQLKNLWLKKIKQVRLKVCKYDTEWVWGI